MRFQRPLPFCRGKRALRRGQERDDAYTQTIQYHRDISLARRICDSGFGLGLGWFGGRYGFRGIRREGGRGGWAVEGEVLGFVVLDGAEEGVVVGGAFGGDLSQEKIDVPRGGDDRAFRGILGGKGGVVALDGSSCGSLRVCAGRKMQGHVRFDLEGRAEFDGGRGGAGRWFRGRIGQAK